jgi:hypothetical protein
MFNRELKVSVVKPNKSNAPEASEPNPYMDPETVNAVAKDFIRNTVLTLGAAFAAKRVLDTVCEIAIIAAKSKL